MIARTPQLDGHEGRPEFLAMARFKAWRPKLKADFNMKIYSPFSAVSYLVAGIQRIRPSIPECPSERSMTKLRHSASQLECQPVCGAQATGE
jgi:hypothetical protein